MADTHSYIDPWLLVEDTTGQLSWRYKRTVLQGEYFSEEELAVVRDGIGKTLSFLDQYEEVPEARKEELDDTAD